MCFRRARKKEKDGEEVGMRWNSGWGPLVNTKKTKKFEKNSFFSPRREGKTGRGPGKKAECARVACMHDQIL
jgi:hypothetical protein